MDDLLGSDFVGRRALVTGGGTGLGAAIAVALAEAGASVVVIGRRPEPLERLAADLAGRCAVDVLGFPADVTKPTQVAAAFKFATASIGAPEIVVNAAGVAHAGPLGAVKDEDVDRVLDVNVRGVWHVVRAAVPAMKAASYGRIVNVASTAGIRGYRYNALYAASKHALLGLTRTLAVELLPHGITVNAVCPGFADTDLVDDAARALAAKTGRTFDDAKAALAAQNPLGRLVRPEEVAAATLYLASRRAAAVNGTSLVVDGGSPYGG
jgi:NAD(P)-dependent dehydrogenase (short-subunit alcohol dehydrogenase family)